MYLRDLRLPALTNIIPLKYHIKFHFLASRFKNSVDSKAPLAPSSTLHQQCFSFLFIREMTIDCTKQGQLSNIWSTILIYYQDLFNLINIFYQDNFCTGLLEIDNEDRKIFTSHVKVEWNYVVGESDEQLPKK